MFFFSYCSDFSQLCKSKLVVFLFVCLFIFVCGSIDAISCIKRVAKTMKHKSKDSYIAHEKKAHASVVGK